MRKRHVLLAAAVGGLAALGTVVAQQPPGYGLPPTGYVPPTGGAQPPAYTPNRVTPPAGNLPATVVRPYSDWSPNGPAPGYTPQQPGGVKQAGAFQPQNPPPAFNPPGGRRLTSPVQAGGDGVRPAGGPDLPPPNMEVPAFRPSGPAGGAQTGPGGRPIAPPSISVEPESKFSAGGVPTGGDLKPGAPAIPSPGTGAQTGGAAVPALPLVPVPPGGAGPKPPAGTGNLPSVPTLPAATGGVIAPPGRPSANVTPTGPRMDLVPPGGGIAPPSGGGIAPPGAIVPPLPTNVAPPAAHVPPAATVAVPVGGPLPSRLAPSVSVEAVCPETVVFGQELRYELVVKNTGAVPVGGVRVEDDIPSGARFVASDPQAEMNGDRLSWVVGTLDAGAEKRIAVRVKPTDEGEVRSRATVSFAASVDARSRVTRPRLAASVAGMEVCRAGEETTFQIKVTNSGSGPAARMILQARLSDGLVHPQGMVIEAELAEVKPGDTKTIPLKVSAAKAGLQWCQVSIVADGSPDATAKAAVNVVEPVLAVKQTGPTKCLVRAEPVYGIELSNPGTAATDPVQLTSVIPDGFEFVGASDAGMYNAQNRTVVWSLTALAPGSVRAVTLKVRSVAATDALLRTFAQTTPPQASPNGITPVGGVVAVRAGGRALESKTETAIKAEGVAAIRFEVVDLEDPVEVGKEALYEIRVTNQGTGDCTNVQLAATMADGTAFTGSSGPTQIKAQGQQLVFEPIQKLAAKSEVTYKVRIRGSVSGDLRFGVQLSCDQVRTPISKEESTRFYKE